MSLPEPCPGDALGLPIPADLDALVAGGPALLTTLFRAFGALPADAAVVSIERAEAFEGGGTGAKMLLDIAYDRPGPPTGLFVKFSRNFADDIRDRTRHHMAPEVRFAALSAVPGFPIAVPRCLFADFHAASGTGILVTERIAYGRDGIEPHYPKCLDREMPDAIGHYRALVTATARLAGAHKAGRLPAAVGASFPFDCAAAIAADRLPATLERKLDRFRAFAAAHPALLPPEIADPAFLAAFRDDALRFAAHEDAIKAWLHDDPRTIALCHWNANVDNAWFRRDAGGTLACGLMDWGSVGQMSVAMTLRGCLSGAETALWRDHLDDLLALFAREFEGAGGPPLDVTLLDTHLTLYVAMMGLAYLLDAPRRIEIELGSLDSLSGADDPRILGNETARVQLQMATNMLDLCRRRGLGRAVETAVAAEA